MSGDFNLEIVPKQDVIGGGEDTTPPTIGDPQLSTDFVNSGGFNVVFTKATDNESPQSALIYRLYTSTTNNLTTDADTVESNGTFRNQGTNVSSLSVAGLSSSTSYFYNIVVEDEVGNKSIYISNSETTLTSGGSGLDSRAGDEQALEDLYVSTNGSSWSNNTGWASSGMSLSNNIYGVTTETIGGELRVTEINLKENNLTGNINNSSLGNLKEMTYFNIFFNTITGQIPSSLGSCASIVYCYLNISSDVLGRDTDPHIEKTTGGGDVHTGKQPRENPGDGDWNVFSGAIPESIGNLTNMKWFCCDWGDLNELPLTIFNCTALEGLHVARNKFNAVHFGTGFQNLTNLTHLAIINGEKNGPKGVGLVGTWEDFWGNNSLPNLHTIRIGSNDQIRGDWPEIASPFLRNFLIGGCYIEGPFPASLVDGSKDLVSFLASWPEGPGWSGTLPEFGSGMQDFTTFNVAGHSLEGEIPASFFHNNPGMIVNNFRDNNFTSVGTSDMTMMWRLRGLRWQNNNISGKWPNLDWDDPNKLDQIMDIEFGGNNYSSADMNYIPPGQSQTIFQLYNSLDLRHFWY